MRILHVVNISFVLPYYIGEQFNFFSSQGVKFYVACQPSHHLIEYSIQQNITPFPVAILREVSFFEDLKSTYLLIKYIKKEKIDIVVGHTPKGGLLGMLAAYFAGVSKRIYFRHGIMYETSGGLKREILKYIEKLTGFLATNVVCVSPSVLKISNNERLSAKSKNIILNKGTCNGIDLDRFKPREYNNYELQQLRKKYNIGTYDRVIGFVGRLVNDKGINELISAWKILIKSENNIKLLLVGPFEERDAVSENLKSDILALKSIIHTGLIDDIAPFYSLMDMFILPSYREGFPTVVLEASAMSKPILTTRSTGCIDSIVENETGIFIDLDPLDIVEKIKRYLDDPSLASEHGSNGRKYVEANFEQGQIWKEINDRLFKI